MSALAKALAVATIAATLLFGQTATVGTIHVTVVDPTEAAIPEAVLEIRDLGTNDTLRAVTQQNGVYTFPNLPFGLYQLTITANGFQREIYECVQVQTGRATEVRAVLRIGGTSETVQVAADATPLLETNSTALATTIDTRQVVQLPIQGRNVFNLAF